MAVLHIHLITDGQRTVPKVCCMHRRRLAQPAARQQLLLVPLLSHEKCVSLRMMLVACLQSF